MSDGRCGAGRTAILTVMAALAATWAGCKKETGAKPASALEVTKSLDPDQFDSLGHLDKLAVITVLTKAHSLPYLKAPTDVSLSVPVRPELGEDLFKLHTADEVLAFLEAVLNRRLDCAVETMGRADPGHRNREMNLLTRVMKEYFEILYVKHYGSKLREVMARVGPAAEQPYSRLDMQLVGAGDRSLAHLFLQAAGEKDAARMQELRAQMEALFRMVKEERVEAEYPFPATSQPIRTRG